MVDDATSRGALEPRADDRTRHARAGVLDAPGHAGLSDADVRDAVADRRFSLQFRPIASVGDDGVVALDSTVVWRHPELGLLRPRDFLPAVAELGLGPELEHWVVGETCEHLSRWREHLDGLTVWVRVSDLVDDEVASAVIAGFTGSEAPRRSLGVEVPARVVESEPEALDRSFGRLGAAGILVAVDDVEAGTPGAELLSRLAIDVCKLGGWLVRSALDGDDRPLRAALLEAARVGVPPVTEGIDRPEALALVEELGGDLVQGTLVGTDEDPAIVSMLLQRLTELRRADG